MGKRIVKRKGVSGDSIGERDQGGRFAAGNSGGPGRPAGTKSARISLERLLDLVGDPADRNWAFVAMNLIAGESVNSMERVEAMCEGHPAVLARVQRMMKLAEIADAVLIRRLERELRAG